MAGSGEASAMAKAREHIEEMRRVRYSIGGDSNQLSEDLHQAVKYLSAELYAKDVHFLMELIQNAEDNKYPEGIAPSLEFVITSKDITATGAPSTLLVFNNEIGFSRKDIDSICRVGGSTKKGKKHLGYIGEKGIGFKSVFLVTRRPYIFSNGYQIRFSEDPLPECSLGYIIPEWVEQPSLSDISQIYGSSTVPTTTLILPLKAEKVEAVKHQLSSVHPEVLLFLAKIKRLSVREDNPDPTLSTVSAISITSETNYEKRKNINAVSYTIHLSAQENYEGVEKECSYYMWRQKFAVNPECREERRMEVEDWVITLAFPYGERLERGTTSPGIYAYLPTEMVTNFPFIIQADFILASSRETILLDRKWNTGILNCVPTVFVEALCALVTPSEYCPVSSLARILDLLPVEKPAYKELDVVRDAIQAKLAEKNILPAESESSQVFFHRPKEVARLSPGFWRIVFKARKQGVTLHNLSSHGVYILHSAFDVRKYDNALEFLGVKHVSSQWYGKCVSSSDLVMGVSEDVYITLLHFFARNWDGHFASAGVNSVPLLKCVGVDGKVSLWSINKASQYSERICLSSEIEQISWLIDWNKEFKGVTERYFMPKSTQDWLGLLELGTVRDWLRKHASIQSLSVNDLCWILLRVVTDTRLLVAFTHFLFHSESKKYLSETEVRQICDSMPIVDAHGRIISSRSSLLVPGKGSKWVSLLGSNPWTRERYIELAQDYESGNHFGSVYTQENQLMAFLESYAGAADIPDLCPPDASFSSINSPLTKTNVFLLLDWIQNLSTRKQLPANFLSCIKEGNWLKTSVGYKAPGQSFLSSSSWGDLLQVGSELVDIPLIDQRFYDYKIASYEDELKKIGVIFEFAEACEFIGKELMSRASSSNLSRSSVITMLKFIRFLREKYLSPEEFVQSIKYHSWLKTSHGYRSPVGSILLDPSWEAALPVSILRVIDKSFYGDCISTYKDELELMGVVVKFDLEMVARNFFLPSFRESLSSPTIYLILDCIRESLLSNQDMNQLKSCSWIRTTAGIKAPSDCFLSNPKWDCMLKIIVGLPLIDEEFYGASIHSYKHKRELEKIGVLVSFSKASEAVAAGFKQLVSSSAMKRSNVLSLLSCFKHLMESRHEPLPESLLECVRSEKWVQTRLGLQKPKDSILYEDEWAAISPISRLPFIDESKNGYGNIIRTYQKQLETFGVVFGMKAGSMLVAGGLHIPPSPSELKPSNLITLLKCLRNLKEEGMQLPEDFMEKVNKKWVKTMLGYVSPRESLLFIPASAGKLHPEDGPFIDESFYGSEIKSFDQELGIIGVSSTETNICSLVAGNLSYHTDLTVITRIYTYLSKCNWKPANKSASWIWIPIGRDGEWVSPQACVLLDEDNLFGSKLRILYKHYDKSLLRFFYFAFGVRLNPDIEDYCKLWSEWEGRDKPLAISECRSFWVFVGKHWDKKTEKLLSERLMKLPGTVSLGEVQLVNKKDVFIPDDLQLKDLLEKNCARAIFVWYPQPSLPFLSRSKLNEIYKSIGVQTISESVVKGEVLVPSVDQLTVINPAEILARDGLLKIVLGFLSDPALDMTMEMRHKVAKSLCNVRFLETKEPIKVSYSLQLSSGEIICVAASRMIRWEREDSGLYLQKLDRASTRRGRIEFATHFSEAISEGLLWESPDQIADLAELIKLGCLLDFEEDAVEFLLKTRNLQIFMEDEEFISSAMSSK